MKITPLTCSKCAAQWLEFSDRDLPVSKDSEPVCGNCRNSISSGRSKRGFLGGLITAISGRRDRPGSAERLKVPARIISQSLKLKADRLAKSTWGSRQDIEAATLTLNPRSLGNAGTHSELVAALQRHVRKIGLAISVPMMTPRVVTERLCDAAGQFVEDDGWVKIVVGETFFDNIRAAKAILCHELCHYVLEANGIRERLTLENERLTDVAMFVFGLGDVFIEGYKTLSNSQYRAGHRLGYLNDDEYKSVDEYVRRLRVSEDFLRTAKRRDDWNWDRSLR